MPSLLLSSRLRCCLLIVVLLVVAALGPGVRAQQQDAEEGEASQPVVPQPFAPSIQDPMLAPITRAPKEITSWEQARRRLAARSTDLRRAQAGLLRARGLWRQALSELLPNARLSLAASYNILDPDTPVLGNAGVAAANRDEDGWEPTVPVGTAVATVTQSLLDVGAWRGLDGASAERRSAELDLKDVRRRITQDLAGALVAVVAAERVAELNRLGLRLSLERAAMTQRTYELGAATELDVVRIRQDVAVARSALIAGDDDVRTAREALGLALGVDSEVGVSTRFELGGLAREIQAHCRMLGSGEQRADLASARALVEAAEERRARASAGYLPTLGLESSLIGLTTDPGPARFSWTISAVLAIPIWEGGYRGGLVQEQAALALSAAEEAEERRRNIRLEIAQSRRGERVSRALFSSATEARSLAERADTMTRRSFSIGRATSIELLQSAVTLRLAELTLAQREFEWVQARLDAFLAEAQCEG